VSRFEPPPNENFIRTSREIRKMFSGALVFQEGSAVNARPWLFLTVSALFEVAWIVSLKLTDGFARLLPLLAYLVSGLGAAVFLSMAMKAIPMGTAYAVWMGVSLVGAPCVDVALFKEPCSAFRVGCALLIVAGTCGLRFATPG
jgi:quaternary ammonium compound-resistance protein SugE